jgi:hypothetical protein
VAAALAVLVGLKEPHVPMAALLQVTAQVTPLFWLSLATVAVRLAVAPAAMDVGGLVIVTVMAGAAMEMVADAAAVVPEEVVAVMVTLVGEAGAVYTVAAPLAVDAGLKEPHGAAAQVTVQATPVPLLTVAVMDAVAPGVRDAGCPLRETVTVAGGGVLLLPPQPEIVRANAASVARRMGWRSFIAHRAEDTMQEIAAITLLVATFFASRPGWVVISKGPGYIQSNYLANRRSSHTLYARMVALG